MIGSFGPSSGNRDIDETGADPASVDISALHCTNCCEIVKSMFALCRVQHLLFVLQPVIASVQFSF
jgi:hypothetical protein